ncbi:ribonuclease R [Chlorobaculum sp. 24CR]|uniref:ribonuclease R n=1 Tax=Chlorobaculum sp. 24CR TaxID=2508878 RepID=UPI0014305BA7|nr:ribonuclease R [Chlorobaculum sp. 24CR]
MARDRKTTKTRPQKRKKNRSGRPDGTEKVRANDHILINEFLFRRGETSLGAEIIAFLTEHEGERFRSVALAKQMGYGESRQLPGFWYVLHKLQEDGVVDKDSDRCYGWAGLEPDTYEEHLVEGRQFPQPGKERYKVDQTYQGKLTTHPNGYGFVSVEGFDDDIFIGAEMLGQSLHGDEVEVLVTKVPETYVSKQSPHQRCEGLVVNVVSRKLTTVVGTLHRENRRFLLKPDLRKILPEIHVAVKDSKKAKAGDKVLAGDLEFLKNGAIQAKVIEILGVAGESNVEVSAIARGLGIDETFDSELLNFAEKVREEITDEDMKDRLDIRDKNVFTIDPVDAKDFDDALSIELEGKGGYKIGVHIADVSHYVPENSALDKEARKRATSVYLVDRVIPMLPSRLSEKVCSLNPGVDRMAYSVFFNITESGEVKKFEFHKTVIHSKCRFTYEDVQEILDAGKGDYAEELQALESLSKILRSQRMESGGLDFETEEVRFKLGSKGEPVEVIKKERLDSHRLIEEFMLLANRTVAAYLTARYAENEKNPHPVIYRVHGAPQMERVQVLSNFVRKIGFDLKLDRRGKESATVSSRALRELLQKVRGTNVEFLVNELVLRSMSKAVYMSSNDGHFGLGFEHYTHFTSPIRRYPDLVIHRILFEYETTRKKRRKVTPERITEISATITEVCQITNEREKIATEAERESVKLKQVEYMSAHLGNTYGGIITGATEYGIYVRMTDFAIEGLVHMRNLKDDYYEYDEATYSLVGRRKHRRLQIGQRLKVKVHEVDMTRRTIDLTLA